MMKDPLHLAVARAQIGVREVPGPKSNPTILAYANKARRSLGIAYTDEATPWCGVFAAYCVTAAGLVPPDIAVRAKSWGTWGEASKPCVGAVLVFERKGGGHVGFYVGEDKDAYHVLGGNQGDAVSITRIAKDRCIAVRWPVGVPKTLPLHLTASGALSLNEQ
jgi:uncharacterized protein (TIGR02594 family)